MVDKNWLANKLASQQQLIEQQRKKRLREWTKPMLTIETRFNYKGYSVVVTDDFDDVVAYDKWLESMNNSGFLKPEYNKKPDFKEQFGHIVDITDSDKVYNNKRMFDIHVKLEDQTTVKVAVFKAEDFLIEDVVFYYKNDKGFPALRRATRAESDAYIPL